MSKGLRAQQLKFYDAGLLPESEIIGLAGCAQYTGLDGEWLMSVVEGIIPSKKSYEFRMQ